MESAAASHAGGLVARLGQLVTAEFRLLSGVRGEVDRLRDEVAIINADLRRLSEADESAVDHSVREWMKQARELAYDAEDCIDLFFFLRISLAPPRAGALHRACRWFLTIRPRARHRLAIDIQDARARAGRLAIRLHQQPRHDRNFVVDTALPRSVWFVPASTTPSTALSKLVGVDDQVQHLSDLVKSDQKLTSDNQRDVSLKVFCIVGFAGLGKTTLAMEVCRSLEEEFACQAMVPVSQVFDAGKDLGRLLKQIIKKVVRVTSGRGLQEEQELHNIDEDDVDELAMMLGDCLDGKRYLIVIDDVWSISAWEAILSRLPDNKCNSRIIVTTRIEHVARACRSASLEEEYYIHRVKPLQFEDAKKLFINAVFGPQQDCPEHLKDIMHKILTRCSGLPLAIFCIVRLLAGYRSPEGAVEMWTRVCNSTGSLMENNPTLNGMRHIITLSYNHLPHHLRACMMYLSLFPEDYVVDKRRLLYRWIAEGLVSEQRGLTPMEVAESYFAELVNRHMIQPSCTETLGTLMGCRVHDMMLDIIVCKALESNFVSFVGGQCRDPSYGSVRRLAIQSDDLGSSIENTNLRHVRSLTTFRPQGHRKLLDCLAEFTLLRVLDLQDCKDLQNKHMKHVCQLFLLRFLSLNGTDITKLPSQMNKLQHLQALWLISTLLVKVPESLVDLEKLEHLGFKNKHDRTILLRLPRHIRKMKALQSLYRFEFREDDAQLAEEIGDLVQLRVLNVVLNCSNCSEAKVLTELAKSMGRCSQNLCKLFLEDMHFNANNMNFLLELPSPPKFLRVLYIGGTIDRTPDWVQSLTQLVEIVFWWTNLPSDEIYGVLYKLPNLSKIILGKRCCSEDKLVASGAFKFPQLKELILGPNDGKPRVFGFEEGAMPKLKTLEMNFHKEDMILDGVQHLTSLKEVRLRGWKHNSALHRAVDQLKAHSMSRHRSEQLKIIVTYF
ncbi:Os07g0197300 [Oryza sativa Japonica Group]|uniref:Stripe rust resistance protein Yr10 n=2 Tax=Oryza sativa subsp. japonica TaxID=39947 RepID=Q69UM1_ORYSJ|nr:hypothetical protein EE612_037681 [Oryza sativa]BAC84179.1 putative stripe rust resistance protein Yr10 [Oryza sativa Japonica Group]BAD30695.1 putative stripe rust resistance protein Yr10 [Oryza sativa Japonica Group]BAT00481.1 Os07g0197300 [Oryza sativa Japonica Group]